VLVELSCRSTWCSYRLRGCGRGLRIQCHTCAGEATGGDPRDVAILEVPISDVSTEDPVEVVDTYTEQPVGQKSDRRSDRGAVGADRGVGSSRIGRVRRYALHGSLLLLRRIVAETDSPGWLAGIEVKDGR